MPQRAASSLSPLTSVLLLAALFVLPTLAQDLCYTPDGRDRNIVMNSGREYQPCSAPKGKPTMCCKWNRERGDIQVDDLPGLCSTPSGTLWRESCTDPTWESNACLKLCQQGFGKVWKKNPILSSIWRLRIYRLHAVVMEVCAVASVGARWRRSAARKRKVFWIDGGKIVPEYPKKKAESSSTSSATPTASATSSSTSPPSSASEPSLPVDSASSSDSKSSSVETGVIVGAVVGGVIGLAIVGALAQFLVMRRRRRNADMHAQAHHHPDMAYLGGEGGMKHPKYYAHELPLHGDQELPSSPDPGGSRRSRGGTEKEQEGSCGA